MVNHIDTTNRNVKKAHEEIKTTDEISKKTKKMYLIFPLLVITFKIINSLAYMITLIIIVVLVIIIVLAIIL